MERSECDAHHVSLGDSNSKTQTLFSFLAWSVSSQHTVDQRNRVATGDTRASLESRGFEPFAAVR